MPYPTERPTAKHDLVLPRLPESGTLQDEIGFSNTASLFQALEQPVPADMKKLAAVYSYPDAPPQPLSRGLMMVGVADTSLSVVRKLIRDDDEIPDCLHKCTVGVKRADGSYVHALPPRDVTNSQAFGNLMKRLRKEGVVGILAQDKLHRFAILKPMELTFASDDDDAYVEDDFVGLCFVGGVEAVKEHLTKGLVQRPKQYAPCTPDCDPPVEESSGDLWKPPGNAGEENSESNEGLWKPPGADQENEGDSGFSWQPPTSSGTEEESFDFANSSSTADPWSAAPEETNGNKRKRESNGNGDDHDGGFHANKGAAAADAFYSGLTRSLGTRADSRIYHMRAFNGWVKATQIQELDPKTKQPGKKMGGPLRVLDLACGKGGDLGKWVLHSRGIGDYVGIDVARGSLRDGAIRARQMRQKLKRCTFTCADLGSDVPGRLKSSKHKHMQKLLSWSLQGESDYESGAPNFKNVRGGGISLEDKFDVVSVQFAIHYMMQTRKRARRFFQTVSQLLEIGGNLVATTIDARIVLYKMMNLGLDLHFDDELSLKENVVVTAGEGACRLQFTPEMVKKIFTSASQVTGDDEKLFGIEYSFTLTEGDDHSAGVGDAVNLPEWLIPIPVLKKLAEDVGLELEYAQNFHEFYDRRSDASAYPSAHSSLYNMKVLNRSGSISAMEYDISRMYVAVKFRKVRESTIVLEDSDVEEEDEDEEDIDPAIKAKFLPMAMMKAKKAAPDGAWGMLSSDEKTRLTNIELRKMASKK